MASTNIYQMVTDRIIEQMNAGVVPWRQPWVGGFAMAISYTTRKTYSMLNQLLLGKPGEWLTWNQIQAKGGRVNPVPSPASASTANLLRRSSTIPKPGK